MKRIILLLALLLLPVLAFGAGKQTLGPMIGVSGNTDNGSGVSNDLGLSYAYQTARNWSVGGEVWWHEDSGPASAAFTTRFLPSGYQIGRAHV